MGSHNMKVVGIDLAGSEKRPTGLCILEGRLARVSVVHTDEEIFQAVGEEAQSVAIDAPLSLPYGRCCLREDHCRCVGQAHFRVCDLELRKMKIKFFPITLGPMRKLTLRGMALKERLEGMGSPGLRDLPGSGPGHLGNPPAERSSRLKTGVETIPGGGKLAAPPSHQR